MRQSNVSLQRAFKNVENIVEWFDRWSNLVKSLHLDIHKEPTQINKVILVNRIPRTTAPLWCRSRESLTFHLRGASTLHLQFRVYFIMPLLELNTACYGIPFDCKRPLIRITMLVPRLLTSRRLTESESENKNKGRWIGQGTKRNERNCGREKNNF